MAVSLSITITQNGQSITNNTSNVTVSLRASWTNGSWNAVVDSSGTPQAKGWLKIDGVTYNFASRFNSGHTTSGSETLFSKTVDISHNSDGVKTLSCSASYSTYISVGTVTASASKALTTIPRKSTLSTSNGTLGTSQTLSITRKSSNFTHTITYKCGSTNGTICTKSSNTSVAWTPPLSLSSQNTSGTSVSLTFTITTYNGDTNIGSNTKTITCSIPSSVKPTCTLSVTDATTYSNKYGNPVEGLSKFKVIVTPTTAYGSGISSYKTTANGGTYTHSSFTTGVLKYHGTLTVSTTVTDKRSRTGSASVSTTVLAYSAPSISKLVVARCESDGTANDQGAYVKVTFSAKITSLNSLNTATYSLRYKPSGGASYTSVSLSDYSGNYTVNNGTYIFEADTGNSYEVEFSAADAHSTSKRATTVSTAFTLVHWKNTGHALAVGKVSELEDTFEIGLEAKFYNGEIVKDPISLTSNFDLDTLLYPGHYIIPSTAVSRTILNKPLWFANETSTAYITVVRGGDEQQRIQRCYVCNKISQFTFQRTYYSTAGWGDWMVVGGSTDWRNLTISTGFAVYGTGWDPKYRVNGSMVNVRGAVKPTTAVASSGTAVTFATGIPSAFCPTITINNLCQGSSSNKWLMYITSSGDLQVARYGMTSYTNIPVNAWLTFNVTYSF